MRYSLVAQALGGPQRSGDGVQRGEGERDGLGGDKSPINSIFSYLMRSLR